MPQKCHWGRRHKNVGGGRRYKNVICWEVEGEDAIKMLFVQDFINRQVFKLHSTRVEEDATIYTLMEEDAVKFRTQNHLLTKTQEWHLETTGDTHYGHRVRRIRPYKIL